MHETYKAKILADSLSPDGIRLTTFWVTFPRFILAEVNTHRMLSRNSNSSRAIPPERQIEKVRTNPFVPETFNKRVKGMGVGEALNKSDMDLARFAWLAAAEDACRGAERLMALNCDKSRINRLLEPFLWHSAIITATEWENFFALRDHPAAQPEFQIIARMMGDAMLDSSPIHLDRDQWHLPGVNSEEIAHQIEGGKAIDWELWKLVSAGRLARWTSYDLMTEDPIDAAVARAKMLIKNFHMSPTEHQARPMNRSSLDDIQFFGNFRGWVQFRKEIPNEENAALAVNLT